MVDQEEHLVAVGGLAVLREQGLPDEAGEVVAAVGVGDGALEVLALGPRRAVGQGGLVAVGEGVVVGVAGLVSYNFV